MRRTWWLVLGLSLTGATARAQPPACQEVTWPARIGSAEAAACAPRGTIDEICAGLEALHRRGNSEWTFDCEVVATLNPDLVLIRSSWIEASLALAAGPPHDRVLVASLEGWSALHGNHPEDAYHVRHALHRASGRRIVRIETRFEHTDDYADVQQTYSFTHTTFCEVLGMRSRDTRCHLQLTTASEGVGREWAPDVDGTEYGAWARRTITRRWRHRARASAILWRDGTVRLRLRLGTWAGLFEEGDTHSPRDEATRTLTFPFL